MRGQRNKSIEPFLSFEFGYILLVLVLCGILTVATVPGSPAVGAPTPTDSSTIKCSRIETVI